MTEVKQTKEVLPLISRKEWDKAKSKLPGTDLSPEKKFLGDMLSVVACYERNLISRRIRAGIARKKLKEAKK